MDSNWNWSIKQTIFFIHVSKNPEQGREERVG